VNNEGNKKQIAWTAFKVIERLIGVLQVLALDSVAYKREKE